MSDVIRIRSITGGIPFKNIEPLVWKDFSKMYDEIERLFNKVNITVQTRRLVLEPIRPEKGIGFLHLIAILDSITLYATKSKIRWVCLPISSENGWGKNDLRKKSRELISRYSNLFIHHIIAENECIYNDSLDVVAQSILDVSTLSNNGFDNFRMGAGANIASNTPFFPFSWHCGKMGFSLAVEVLGPIISELKKSKGDSLEKLREKIIDKLSKICIQIDTIAKKSVLLFNDKYEYKGLDISLAPYPDSIRSVARLVEHISSYPFGSMGTLSATAFLTDILKEAIKRSEVRAIGFNGVMYSQLEDTQLAKAVSRNVDMLLEQYILYSTVCGCGVDMVPIAGNTLNESLEKLLLDISTLSSKLKKPLGVRVLPIPMKRVNEFTSFNHDFLTNSRILKI